MLRRGGYLVALLLVAWTMGLEFAHVLEWAPKARYTGRLYVHLQESLYVWFGNVGGVIYLLAVLASVVLAASLRSDRAVRGPLAAAATLEVIALVVFLSVVYPVNFRFPVHGSGAVPADWAALRGRWELGHTIGFVLFTAAFILLMAGALRPGSRAVSRRASDDVPSASWRPKASR